MAEETRKLIVTQPKGDAFHVAGSAQDAPIAHRFEGGDAGKPLMHMHYWDDDCTGRIEGQLVVRGDREAPVAFEHRFPDTHHQAHVIETALAEPIHHALQMRTPLQLRFCNSWQIGSDYVIGVDVGGRRLIDIRLTGATVATPLPCADDCPPPKGGDAQPSSGPAAKIG